ncbi:tannase/feruloyl esterase family alpha/beta hydrolase [Rhizobium pusense]|nr:tannase/feruloyl esterase family alpha/beta hydrolase [Agrobacterium pusense]MBW9085043.1 tannase/feruloyl esterase family alpha/beta hydrolase [Agrobacterium pusense]MBW9125482.1 tannase/feruloyl esterase family alpha/beta hydrolase [Agrobacterium pusense]MBW9137897.1 tannase/feruloyl esterase family alpha/beta hydrolase [Agrobacterium pusense]
MPLLLRALSPLAVALSVLYASTSPAFGQAGDAAMRCAELNSFTLSANAITLPTSGARVTSATFVASDDTANQKGEFCRVLGETSPVDPQAPKILWQVNLPGSWNGKLLQYGGGGYNGSIPPTTEKTTLGLDVVPTPLEQGYVTFGSDSGHQAPNADDASFGKNDEAMLNYGYMHIRKTLDVAKALVERRYAKPIRRVYYQGGSTGGREGLTAASRWPDAYDGILTNYPTANFVGLRLWGAGLARAIYDDKSAGWIPPKLVETIAKDAIASCDALDGAKDGLISDASGCRKQSAALVEKLACKAGESGNPENCLTNAQIDRTLKIYHDGYALPYPLANGIDSYPGYNSLEGILMQLGSEPQMRDPPVSGPNAHHSSRAFEFLQNFVARGQPLDLLSFDIRDPGKFKDRIVELSGIIGATQTDWSAFADKGGKIIWLQGTDDPSVSPYGNAKLYEAIVAKMGREKSAAFLRFYLVPGLAHGGGRFSPAWDNLAALDNWVENGVPPVNPIVMDATKSDTRGRTRPLCEYPSWPKYKGTGDMSQAASFTCARD